MTLTPQPTDSLVEYVTHQGDLLTRMAAQAETLGFCVVMHGLNQHTHNNRLHNYIAGGFGDLFDTWCRIHGRKYVRVNLWFTHPLPNSGPIIDRLCEWRFNIPRTRRMRPIVVALDLMCDVVADNPSNYSLGMILRSRTSQRPLSIVRNGYHEYRGGDRPTLELALGVLKMKQHHEILTDQYTPREPLKR